MRRRYPLNCLGEEVTMIVDEKNKRVAFDGWDEEAEEAWLSLGGDEPSPCWIVAKAAADDSLDRTFVFHIENGNLAVVKALLYAGAEIDGVENEDKEGKEENDEDDEDYPIDPPLHVAIWANKPEVINFLLAEGASTTEKDSGGLTPLHVAAAEATPDLIKKLYSTGADINARDFRLQTPLYRAAFDNRGEVVALLVALGADINITDEDGNTPAHEAALGGNVDAFRILAAVGANINAKNNEGIFIEDWGIVEGQDEGAAYVIADLIGRLREGKTRRSELLASVAKKYPVLQRFKRRWRGRDG